MRKKKWLLITLVCVLAGTLCLAAGALGMRHLQTRDGLNSFFPNNNSSSNNDVAHLLYVQKHPYIGCLPADLLQLLTLPKEMYRFANQLHTKQEPYGLQLWCGTDEAGYQAFLSDPGKQELLQKNALIILALIDNCDFVQYSLLWDDVRIDYSAYPGGTDFEDMGQGGFTLTYTKAWADATVAGGIKTVAATEESFRAFLGSMDQLQFTAVEPEMIE